MTVGGVVGGGTHHEGSTGDRGHGMDGGATGNSDTTAGFERGVDGIEASHGLDTPTAGDVGGVKMGNHWITAVIAVLVWLIIVVMNVALLVLVGLGVS